MSKKSQRNKQAKELVLERHYSGPIPDPLTLSQYEQIQPGLADRIMKMAENQSSHRQSLETKVVNSNIINEKLGMGLNFIISLVVVIGGFLLVYKDKNAAGTITALTPIIINGIIYFYNKIFASNNKKNSN